MLACSTSFLRRCHSSSSGKVTSVLNVQSMIDSNLRYSCVNPSFFESVLLALRRDAAWAAFVSFNEKMQFLGLTNCQVQFSSFGS